MLKILLRTRMEALLSVLTGASRTNKAQSKATLAGFAEAIKGLAAVAQTPAEAPLSLQEWHARGLA